MTKQETKTEITKIAKSLNRTFLEIANTILEQGTKKVNVKNINELIQELD